MRLLVLSDLHVEHAPFEPGAVDADVVVLAGDIHNGADALLWARATFPDHPIVQIAGNHEFYDREYDETLARLREVAQDTGIHFLENDAVVINDVRFLGCTLWTDYRVFEAPGRPKQIDAAAAMDANRRLIADYFAVRMGERALTPEDTVALHARSRGWLEYELARPFDGPTVVVTHHLPSWRSVNPAFARWVTNAGFASDLDRLVERADWWIHGHTHCSFHYAAGRAQVACNPRGYPQGVDGAKPPQPGRSDDPPDAPAVFENPSFEPAFRVDVLRG